MAGRHEYVFLLSRSSRYFCDSAAIADVSRRHPGGDGRGRGGTIRVDAGGNRQQRHGPRGSPDVGGATPTPSGPSPRSRSTAPHFATMPPRLAERCILAGSKIGDEVIDPFSSGDRCTTRHGRRAATGSALVAVSELNRTPADHPSADGARSGWCRSGAAPVRPPRPRPRRRSARRPTAGSASASLASRAEGQRTGPSSAAIGGADRVVEQRQPRRPTHAGPRRSDGRPRRCIAPRRGIRPIGLDVTFYVARPKSVRARCPRSSRR